MGLRHALSYCYSQLGGFRARTCARSSSSEPATENPEGALDKTENLQTKAVTLTPSPNYAQSHLRPVPLTPSPAYAPSHLTASPT